MVLLKTNVRVRAEGSGITAKSVVTFLVLMYDVKKGDGQGKLALFAFALGQLAYSLACLVVYLGYFGAGTLWPQMKYVFSVLQCRSI
jgi:oligosaccharide translocation protein RFT1